MYINMERIYTYADLVNDIDFEIKVLEVIGGGRAIMQKNDGSTFDGSLSWLCEDQFAAYDFIKKHGHKYK